MTQSPNKIIVTCPTCQTQLQWNEAARYRPFCSKRCQQVDLGAWSSEAYRIPSEQTEQWSESDSMIEQALLNKSDPTTLQ